MECEGCGLGVRTLVACGTFLWRGLRSLWEEGGLMKGPSQDQWDLGDAFRGCGP